MSAEVEWVEAPPPIERPARRGKGRRAQFVNALRARPGQWARYPHDVAHSAATATYREACPGTEWVARKRPDGRVDLYARWVGEQ